MITWKNDDDNNDNESARDDVIFKRSFFFSLLLSLSISVFFHSELKIWNLFLILLAWNGMGSNGIGLWIALAQILSPDLSLCCIQLCVWVVLFLPFPFCTFFLFCFLFLAPSRLHDFHAKCPINAFILYCYRFYSVYVLSLLLRALCSKFRSKLERLFLCYVSHIFAIFF